ncbi:MAG: hypothetical protein LBK01_00390 [Burkholderiaceae bacterium]|jgi:hypothetical protein|nr:hypothetical protein [Burkholderiaceae bacterium]
MNSTLFATPSPCSSPARFISNLFRGVLVVGLVCFFCGVMSPVLAENITYRGSSGDLQDMPAYFSGGGKNTLAPAGYTSIINNTIIIDYLSGTDPENVWGGYSSRGNVMNNRVILQNGKVKELRGGYSDNGSVTNNMVSVSGGSVRAWVYGGDSVSGNVTGNAVTISRGTVHYVRGGHSVSGAATNNTVTISGGTMNGVVYGGLSYESNATGNTVTISGGIANDTVYGGRGNRGRVTNNTVSISGGIVRGGVSGGDSRGSVTNNTVSVSGGIVNGTVSGGNSISGTATGNTVTISGGTVYGGVDGGFSMHNSATANTVTLKNASVGRKIVGGVGARKAGAATGNTVTLAGEITFILSTDILGGRDASVSNNTLNLIDFRQMGAGRVGRVSNFDRLHFSGLKADQARAILTAANVNLDNSRTTLLFDGKPGTVRLIEAASLHMVNARIDPVEYGGVRYGFHWDSEGNAVVGNSGVGE